MSRSRNIKPGFFRNELLVELPFEYRLLFVGLWTLADRAGRLEDRPTKIRMEVFPADAVDVEAGLQALHDRGFIARYTVGGQKLVQVVAWAKHQNPHHREAESTLPAQCEPEAITPCMAVEPEALPGPAPERHGPAVLIPDSLIPDSLQEQVAIATLSPDGAAPACPHSDIIALYHEHLPANPRIKVWDGERAKALRTRWREDPKRQSLDYWRRLFLHCAASDFLTGRVQGRDGRSFLPGLDWMVNRTNFAKIIEGRYHERAAA